MKKSFKNFVAEQAIGVDKVVRHKDGTFSLKSAFFYRHGRTAEKFADRVSADLKEAGVKFTVEECFEDWNSWPKDSWFVARIRVESF